MTDHQASKQAATDAMHDQDMGDARVYFNAQEESAAQPMLLPQNIGDWERIGSIAIGLISLFLLSRRLIRYFLLAGLSVYLLYRGLTGYCYLYDRTNLNTRRRSEDASASDDTADQRVTEQWMERPRDVVDQASWESFPASDPPGFH